MLERSTRTKTAGGPAPDTSTCTRRPTGAPTSPTLNLVTDESVCAATIFMHRARACFASSPTTAPATARMTSRRCCTARHQRITPYTHPAPQREVERYNQIFAETFHYAGTEASET